MAPNWIEGKRHFYLGLEQSGNWLGLMERTRVAGVIAGLHLPDPCGDTRYDQVPDQVGPRRVRARFRYASFRPPGRPGRFHSEDKDRQASDLDEGYRPRFRHHDNEPDADQCHRNCRGPDRFHRGVQLDATDLLGRISGVIHPEFGRRWSNRPDQFRHTPDDAFALEPIGHRGVQP